MTYRVAVFIENTFADALAAEDAARNLLIDFRFDAWSVISVKRIKDYKMKGFVDGTVTRNQWNTTVTKLEDFVEFRNTWIIIALVGRKDNWWPLEATK